MVLQARWLTGPAPAALRPFTPTGPGTCRPRQPLRLRVAAAAIDPDNASILVAGGGGVALEVTRRLKDSGAWVWQLQRTDVRREEIEGMMAIVAKGDAMSPEDLERVFASIDGVDAVVSTLGGSPGDASADGQGNINLIEAAARHGVKKFVLVTSIGTGDSRGATPPKVYEALKPVLLEKDKAEQRLMEIGSGMDWVIVRPGGLKTEAPTGKGVLTEDKTVCGAITRADVADLVVRVLRSDNASAVVLSAIDSEQVFGAQQFETFAI